jgi:hypothetical protein
VYCIVAVEVEIYKTVLKQSLIYGCQTCCKTEKQKIVLNPWVRKILRKLYGPVTEKEVWRIRTNQELKELHETTHFIEDFKGEGLSGWGM